MATVKVALEASSKIQQKLSSSIRIPSSFHPGITRFYHKKDQIRPLLIPSSIKHQKQQSLYKRNISRFYARRQIDILLSLSLAHQSVAKLESSIAKPLEWSVSTDRYEKYATEAKELGSTKISRVYAAGSRILNLFCLACPLFLLIPLAKVTKTESLEDLAWEYGLWSIEKAGPTFIKLTQWASTRSDLFPAEFCARFARLQDETRGHSWKVTRDMLKKAYGDNYTSLLNLEHTPIGSGCIAQVYRATLLRPTSLLPEGTNVAIKVQHPHIGQKVCVDFYILQKVSKLLEKIPYLNLEYLSLRDSVQEFKKIMLPQLDLRIEARNLSRFRRDFSGDDTVTFPQPIHELTSDQILVETFVHGEPILHFTREHHTDEERHILATNGLQAVMKMIFLYDFIHGDLHPGNILIDHHPTSKTLRLNMIDCGLVVEMGEREHKILTQILGALIKRDGYLAAQLMVDSSRKFAGTPYDITLFCEGIDRICKDDEENNFLEKVGDYLAEICFLACKHQVKLEATFINAALACEIMEGIASKLYPEMVVQKIALPMVLKAEVMHGLKAFKMPKIVSGR